MIIYILILLNLSLFLYMILHKKKSENFISDNYKYINDDEDEKNIIINIGKNKHSNKNRYVLWLLENKNNIEILSDNDINNLLKLSNNLEITLTDKDKVKFENLSNNITAMNY